MAEIAIADELLFSAGRLNLSEQGRVFGFIAKLRANPTQPGLRLERLTRAWNAQLWSGRISDDLRAILHREGDTLVVLYAGYHDAVYEWAEGRRVERNPATGAPQIVETTERVEQRIIDAPAPPAAAPLFAGFDDALLRDLGVAVGCA